MKYLFLASIFLINATAFSMEFCSFDNIGKFLKAVSSISDNKENSYNGDMPNQNFKCSLKIDSIKELQKFYTLHPEHLSLINKISISVKDATQKDASNFKIFLQTNYSYFTNLTEFVSSGLKLEDDIAATLSKITGLMQIDLIEANITNKGLICLIANGSLKHINAMNNTEINDDVISEITRMDKNLSELILILAGTSIDQQNAKPLLLSKGIELIIL